MQLSKVQANFALLLSSFIWGTSYTFIKQATNANMPAGMINAFRGFIFATLIYVFFHKTINKMTWREFRLGAIGGLINFSVVQLQTSGLKYTTPSNSSFITAIYVLFLPFVAWVVFREKPKSKVYFAIILCMVGMLFLTNIIHTGFQLQVGDLLTMAAALFFSFQIVYYSYVGNKDTNPLVMAFMLGLTQIVVSSSFSLLFERQIYATIQWEQALPSVIILGVTASFIAQSLQIISQQFTDATTAGLILMNESIFASAISVIIGLEALTPNLVIGGGLIFSALLLMQLDFSKLPFLKKTKQEH